MFKPYIFTPLHFHKPYLTYLKTNYSDFCDIKCTKKRAKNSFNVQRLLTNVKKIMKLYLQWFFAYFFTYHIEITICSSLNKHTLNILSHIFTQKGIPWDNIKTTFSLLVATLYSMFSM